MRLLVLYQARDASRDQPGYFTGFERMVAEGELDAHLSISYFGIAESEGWDALWRRALAAADSEKVDAVFLQFFHADMPDPGFGISRIKNLPQKPAIFSSLGDPFGRWTKRIPRSFRVASKLSDVSFLTGMGYLADQLAGWGSNNIVLMPNGCCQVRFAAPNTRGAETPLFDLVFIGSRMKSVNPLNHFFWVSRSRVEFVEAFTKRYGKRFGLFGNGWEGNPSWHGPVPYAAQHETYRTAAVVLGGMPNAYHAYYTSDRAFIAAASGIPFVDYWVTGVERLLRPGVDWWLAEDLAQMFRHCDMLLDLPSDERISAAEATRKKILGSHTQYHRCVQMVEIVRSLIAARRGGKRASRPRLPFFGDQTETNPTRPDSIVAWTG